MPRFPKAALACAIALLAAMPASGQENATADTVVATVNGQEITVGHMIVLRARLPQQYQSLPDNVLYEGILDQLIQQSLLGETVDDISKLGEYVLDNERRALLASEAVAAISESVVTDEAVQAAYDDRFADAEPETEFNASHILVETEEEAHAVIEKLNAGADFAELAREKSTGPSGPNGGNLGWFGKGMMVAPFEEAVLSLEPGTTSGPVQTQFGWHVVRLNEVRLTEPPPLDEIRQELEESIRTAAVESQLEELLGSATIDRTEGIDASVLSNGSLLQD